MGRISPWKSKFLFYIGVLILIKPILFNIQVYWSSLFIVPTCVHKEIDKLLRAFLWCGVDLNFMKAKVAWDEVYTLKKEGSLGIMKIKTWNKAAIVKHIW